MQASIKCMIATCAQLPNLDPDDHLLAEALARLGARVTPAVWNDPTVEWRNADLCVVRSTWDYHRRKEAFDRWIDTTSNQTRLINPPSVLRWNSHKYYLRELERQGIPVVPTLWLDKGAPAALSSLLERAAWVDAVIKPAHGASADGIFRVGADRAGRAQAQLYLNRLLKEQDVLVQPYLSTIAAHHERALVFIDGEYSHAVTKTPFMHANADLALRAFHPPGASGEVPVQATEDEIAVASRALQAAPAGHVYARVDLVRDAGVICVLEIELIEPTLYLFARHSAASKLATAILAPRSDRNSNVT